MVSVSAFQGRVCAASTCSDPATRQCPTCIQLAMQPTFFCSQACFKACWKQHNQLHKQARLEKDRQEFQPPSFTYTGPLRPHYVTPRRSIPDHIAKPDYAADGFPSSEAQRRGDTNIDVKTPEQIEIMRETCRLGREVLDIGARAIGIGVTTEEIDIVVHNACIERGVYPSPLNYNGFPKACCTSVNEVICHGIPDARPLQDGDIVNIDISVYYKGHHADLNETYFVGNVDDRYKKLAKAAYESLMLAIEKVRPGALFRDFGNVIAKYVKRRNFSVVKSYCGHGIGQLFHCAPNVPHYARNKAVGVCKPGMTFTIEPMLSEGDWRDVTWPDDWTAVTADGMRSAQFEHTLLVTDTGCEILTARLPTSPPLFLEETADTIPVQE